MKMMCTVLSMFAVCQCCAVCVFVACAVVQAEDDTAADSDDGSTGGGRLDRGGSTKKTVASLKTKIKKKKKRRGSEVRYPLAFSKLTICQSEFMYVCLDNAMAIANSD